MIATPTTRTSNGDLAQLTAAAEQARDQAAEASARASAAMAKAQLAAEKIAVEQDHRFVRWAETRVAESNETLKTLTSNVDAARKGFESSVAAGSPDFLSRFLDWSESGARLYHYRNHVANLNSHLHHRRPGEFPPHDASRSTSDSKTTIPSFADALARAADMASAARGGHVEDELQNALQSALRGEDPVTPDRRDG